ncbi:MAG: riboflavin synthase [Alphaproteobacteria bacterium]|nr:riboflavin synthase [Alphaproteobacteria bacterium]HCQ71332.1 riboflavin synthase [Rhodospirillaceae bacterium]|tara:strand:+ start:41575 stop:42165 length:591 start_codon:yes stop_codon:yes gene_type:complete
MFTGIIQDIGTVQSIDKQGDWRFVIKTALPLADKPLGASIACAGCCLTVVEKGADWFAVDVSGESLSKTTLGTWEQGTRLNLEPALRAGDELGGHIVSGHVDGLATLQSIKPENDSHILRFSVPQEFAAYIAPKGSITLNGVSLTVNDVENNEFTVNIIPHTWEVTTLGHLKAGDALNFEVDMLARYILRQREVLS